MYSIADTLDITLNHRLESLFNRHEVNYQGLDRLTASHSLLPSFMIDLFYQIGIQSRLQEIDHEFSMMKQVCFIFRWQVLYLDDTFRPSLSSPI